MQKLFQQYKGLSRDIYILFVARVVQAMGTFIWPMLTLILKVKFQYDALTISTIILVGGLINMPAVLLGGKLADRYGRKTILLIGNYGMVLGYFVNALLPLGVHTIVIFFLSGFFGNLTGPASTAMVADKSSSKDREKAYSLSYLGWNLGFVLGPSIGGFLFKNYLGLAFFIDGLTTLLGTMLIHRYITEGHVASEEPVLSEYEQAQDHSSILDIFKQSPVMWLYLGMLMLTELVYFESNFILPLHLESLMDSYSEYFGILYSFNGLIVILFTPVITLMLKKTIEIHKFRLGMLLYLSSFLLYAVLDRFLAIFVVGMFLFTLGEISFTISRSAYYTRRIPKTHRARMDAIINLTLQIFVSIGQLAFGFALRFMSYNHVWFILVGISVIILMMFPYFVRLDQKRYPNMEVHV